MGATNRQAETCTERGIKRHIQGESESKGQRHRDTPQKKTKQNIHHRGGGEVGRQTQRGLERKTETGRLLTNAHCYHFNSQQTGKWLNRKVATALEWRSRTFTCVRHVAHKGACLVTMKFISASEVNIKVNLRLLSGIWNSGSLCALRLIFLWVGFI